MEKPFNYRAIDGAGKVVQGTMSAVEKENVLDYLRQNELRPIDVQQVVVKIQDREIKLFTSKKVKLKEFAVFCRQVATMLGAGVSINKALEILHAQTENAFFKESLKIVSDKVKQGTPLSKAMAEQPKVYPNILVSMVQAGEMNGKQDEAFENMALHFEKEHKINHKVKGAMIYPIVLVVVMVAVTALVMVAVVPMFKDMFEAANTELPGPTKALLAISKSMSSFWYIYLGVIVAIVMAVRGFLNSVAGRMLFDKFKMRGPKIISRPMQQIVTARFTRTVATLLSSGISIIDAVVTGSETTNNVYVVEKIEGAAQGLKQGRSMIEELSKTELFPDIMLSMVRIGEETGAVDDLMLRTANYYEEEMDAAVSKLLSLMEPALIIIMAFVLGFVLIALMVPMLTMGAIGI